MTLASQGCFRTRLSRETCKSTSGDMLIIFGDRTYVPISWTCKKQTAISHSSTESVDAGLRMEGLSAAFYLMERVGDVASLTGGDSSYTQLLTEQPQSTDHVPSNTEVSKKALSIVLKNKEAVIKMIIKCKCLYVRHVFETFRVDFCLFFERLQHIRSLCEHTWKNRMRTFSPRVLLPFLSGMT